jgi:hypothetical protein
MKTWHHVVLWLLVGYALGYWAPALGNLTLGKLYRPSA